MEWLHTYCLKHHRWLLWLAFPLLSLLMHSVVLDLPLQGIHAWRQCETASNVHNFAFGDHDILNPHVFNLEWEGGLKRMEFPVMQWLFALGLRVFGDHVIVLRLLSWILGFVTLLGFYALVKWLFQDRFLALAGAWAWMFSPVIFYYSINPLPDNFSLMAAVWGTAFFVNWHKTRGTWPLLLSFACISLATATKLPFVVFAALPYSGLLAEVYRARAKNILRVAALTITGTLLLTPALLWYAWVIPQWTGNGVVKGILDSTQEDIPLIVKSIGKNILSILPELLLNYAAVPFFLLGIYQIIRRKLFRHSLAFPFGMLALGTGAYFIFEINMITSIHDYYLFPFLPGIFLLVAIGFRYVSQIVPPRWRMVVLCLLLVLPVTAGLRSYPRWSEKGMPKGMLANVDALRNAVPADAKIIFGNDLSPHISLYHLRHFGWTVDETNLDSLKLADWIQKGASYFYSNSRDLEENGLIAPHLGKMAGEWDGIRVWEVR